ncbi:hypothetical protein DYB26_001986 [Aphanomyces astaci]|uniref:Uncharacterized protein n=4 Tax=Aphanomyces astaci TaxID=112090 RepID=A0A397F1R6_APHAT|nr:hypothetical protein DYB26_001986 [Aphanomyces astaci]RHZ12245.1 hypothetical protein DYB31_004093 [Aphanomyces astaci]
MAKLSKSPPQLVTTQRTSPDKPWFRRCILACLTLQVLWTLAIPIKNVLIIPYPQFRSDDLSTSKQPYEGYDPDGNLTFSGDQVHALLLDVLAISFRNAQVRAIFQQKEDFAIDKLGQVLSPIDHKTMAQYYTLVFQSSEFPGGVFTEREDRVVSAQADGTKQVYTIGCRGDQTLMGGTTCIDANGLPCDDSAWGDTQTRTLKDVDFTPLLNGTGWQNNIGLLGLVEYFHYYMRLVFAKQNWAAVVASKNLDMGYIQVDDEGNVVEVPVIFNLATQSSRAIALNSSKIWNCLATEALLGEAYLANYTLGLIQSVLIEQNLYNATTLVTKSQIVTERALVVLRGSIRITSGAGYAGSRDTIKLLGNTIMTHTSVSSINLKRDRPMTGSQLMGSSMRNIMYMGYYPNSYYSVLKIFPNGSDFVFQSRALGGMFSGYNGFKFDFVHNTMTNFKLAERSVAAGSGYAYDWFAQERDIAAWYSKYESHRGNNLIDKAVLRFGASSGSTACLQALFKRIAQASWLVLLQWHPTSEHLAFMSVNAQSTPEIYFFKQMLKNEIVAENSYGYRVPQPFNPTHVSAAFGTAWPMIPILSALVLKHGAAAVAANVLEKLNTTFLQLVDFTSGSFHFHDVSQCSLSNTITADDTAESTYSKMYLPLALLIDDILAEVESIRVRMELELGQSIQVRGEYINDTRTNSIFKYVGPPVYWSHTPLSVGLLRLSTKSSPDEGIVNKLLKNSLVCYDVLETRYLNVSTRCWSELGNINETRAQYNSEALRTLLLSVWSMGIVLNLFAAVVALSYARRMIHVAKVTGLNESWRTLLFIDVQEFGMSPFTKCALMACSAAPFMFGYQLPQDSEYIAHSSNSYLGSIYLDELMVSLGITWFIRLGTDIGRSLVQLQDKSVTLGHRVFGVRAVVFSGVYLLRILNTTTDRTYNRAMSSLALSCALSTVAAIVATQGSYMYFKRTPTCNDAVISAALQRAGVSAVELQGVLQHRGTEWSYMRMVLHGWTCVTDVDTVVFKSAASDLLVVVNSRAGVQVQKLHVVNHANYVALESAHSADKSRSHDMAKAKSYVKPKIDFTHPLSSKVSSGRLRMGAVTMVVIGQALWALGMPLRNILLFPIPTFNYDNTSTTTTAFAGFANHSKLQFTGTEVLAVVHRVLDISLANADVRKVFETSGEYAIDSLGQMLSPADHQMFAQLYAMVFQASEFPAGSFTPREENVVRNNPDGTTYKYTIRCKAEESMLDGVICVDATGEPCASANTFGATSSRVNMTSLFTPKHRNPETPDPVVGWQNNVGLITFVDYFFAIMGQVFAKQDWPQVVEFFNSRRAFESVQFTPDGELIESPDLLALVSNDATTSQSQIATTIYDCLVSELVLTDVYIANYTMWLVQTALASRYLYNAAAPETPNPRNPLVHDKAVDFLQRERLYITSAAGYFSFEETTHMLFSTPMTSTAISSTTIKRDLGLSNADTLGSSVQHIRTLVADKDRYFSTRRILPGPDDNAVIVETRLLGGRYGGYLGFKASMLHNTMGVFKLSERPTTPSTLNDSTLLYFDQDAAIAKWYAAYENEKGTGNLLSRVTEHFGTIRVKYPHGIMEPVTTDTYETSCYQALMRRVSQIVWLTALRLHPGLQYLVFMSAQNDVSNHDWFLQQMTVNEVVGENAYGGRVHVSYNALFVSSNLGSGWPLIPLVTSLSQVYNASYLHDEIMTEMNHSLTSLIEIELGLVNFRDSPHCPIGQTLHGVTKDDTLDTMYEKVFPAFSSLVQDIIVRAAPVQTKMEADLQLTVRVPLEYLSDTRPTNRTSDALFPFQGPPIQWTHTPLGVGLMRLSTKENPFQDNVDVLHHSLVCYDTLETRYLTRSVRCWSETLSSGEVRASYSSANLRVVLFSAWAIGVMLNALGVFIALRYVAKLYRMWHLTRFDLAKWELGLLLSTHFQSLGGVISIHETATLASSSLALQFAFRMPQDPGFVVSTTSFRRPYFDELIITLGMTWAIHLGMELGGLVVSHRHNHWVVKAGLSAAVYALLVATQSPNYNFAIATLIGIWLVALLSGFICIAFNSALVVDRRLSPKTCQVHSVSVGSSGIPDDTKVRPHPPVGHLSQRNGRWSLLGIVLEGWRGVQTGTQSFLMARQNVLVHLLPGRTVEPLVCRVISPLDFNQLVQAMATMKNRDEAAPK